MLTCPHCQGPLQLSAVGVPSTRVESDDLRRQLLEYLATVRYTDVQTAAAHLLDSRSRVQVERVRRMLERLVRNGVCTRSTANVSGWNGGRVTTYTLTG